VEQVCGGWVGNYSGVCPAALSLLGALLDTSMASRVPGTRVRVTMLGPVRQYARARLAESGRQQALREAYFEYCLTRGHRECEGAVRAL
jgi:hypothetical protein